MQEAERGDRTSEHQRSAEPLPGRARRAARTIVRAAHRQRKALALIATVVVSVMAYAAAFVVRFEVQWPDAYTGTFIRTVGWLVSARIGVSFVFGLNAHRWRYSSGRDIGDVLVAAVFSSAVFLLVIRLVPVSPRVPNSVVLLELVFASYVLGGLRMGYRVAFEWYLRRVQRFARRESDRVRVLIAGAGEAGSFMCQDMVRYPELGYVVVGFVDDDRGKARTRMWGASVLGSLEDIPSLVSSRQIDEVVVAMPSAPPSAFRRLVNICEAVDVKLTILPHERDVLKGTASLSQLREVHIEDLLGREPIELELPELKADLAGEAVLITGAAGSIGSELARQVALHSPATLVLLDQAETDLFYLDLELRVRHPELNIVPVVADITDASRVAGVFEKHEPSRVYHAAAYKHVPLMEENPSEAIRNNVIGTWEVATAAGRAGAGKFVFVSTDKAVNPTSVMGMTKRAAELAILSCADLYPDTHFTAVRFGNVMGSQGSVIPIFKRQLAEGRKLTVTDPEATRFFMTIPEAVQLVLQASLLPEARSHVAMLDMGQPVRVIDMARNLLRLHGETHPDERIEIIGLRRGEKLHEVLTFEHEESQRTVHPKVWVVRRARERGKLELYVRLRMFHASAVLNGDGERLENIWETSSSPEEREAIRFRSEAEGARQRAERMA